MINTLDTLNVDISRDDIESNVEDNRISHGTLSTTEVPQSQNENESTNSDETLAQLVAMGFELSLAQIAVNENKDRDFDATLQWLSQQQSDMISLNELGEEIEESDELNSASNIKPAPYRRPISAASAAPPKKGILKPPPPSNTRSLWKRDWLSTLNTHLQNVTSATTAPNSTSFFAVALKRLNSSTTQQEDQHKHQHQQQMPQQEQRQPSKVLHINTTPADQSNSQNSLPSPLTPKALKRVRFSVAKLTDEYPHSPIPGEDEYDFWEWSEKQKQEEQMQPDTEQKSGYTPKEIIQFYLTACRNREEFPIDRLVEIFRKASQTGSPLNVVDLTGDIIDRKITEPIADILTLEFGLQKLILERCDIEDDTMKIICHSLLVNDTLSYLNLRNNKKLRTNGFNYIAVYIRKSMTLTYIDLSGIIIDKKSGTFLAQALIHGHNGLGATLETLKLDNCGIKNAVLEVLGPGIRRSNLRTLSIRFNHINHAGAVWIGVMLRDYEYLNSESNGDQLSNEQPSPSSPAFNEQEEARAENLRRRKHGIETLDASGNDLRSGIQFIAQALRRNQSLKELNVQDNRIDPKGLVFMMDGLKYNHTLESLNLNRNPIGGPSSEGVIALRNGLPLNTTLKGLFLSDTNLSSEGAIAIAEYIPETNSLLHLDLTANPDIDIAGIMALAVSIKMNYSIRVLDVNVHPNDNEMSSFSRDILRACVRNTEMSQENNLENSENDLLLTGFETKSDSMLSEAAGLSNHNESSEFGLGMYVKDLKRNMNIAKENLEVFEEMLASEEKRSSTEKVESNEVIDQLYDQCKNVQVKIRPYISVVTDEGLLGNLLVLNDSLLNALQKYEKLYNNSNNPFLNQKTIEPKVIENIIEPNNNNNSSNINSINSVNPIETSTVSTEKNSATPLQPSDDIEDNGNFGNKTLLSSLQTEILHNTKSSKSSLEEMNKLLEVEEGEMLKKAKKESEQEKAEFDQ